MDQQRAEHQAYRMQEARKIMGFALKDSPEAYFEAIGKPPLPQLSDRALRHTAAEYTAAHGEKSGATDLFVFGLEDSTYPLLAAIDKHPDASREELLTIMDSEETLKTQARIARLTQEQSTEVFFRRNDFMALDETRSSVILAQELVSPAEFGCPATRYGEQGIEAIPLFYRFARWAGNIAVLSYFDHRE